MSLGFRVQGFREVLGVQGLGLRAHNTLTTTQMLFMQNNFGSLSCRVLGAATVWHGMISP